jgi:hypothetical protein
VRSVEEIQAARAARKASNEAARVEQYAKDLDALDALEVEHGDGRVCELSLPAYRPGLPTLVVVVCPAPDYYKRFQEMVRRAKGEGSKLGPAADLLADHCVAYPAKDVYAEVRKAFPGVHDSVAAAAAELSQAKGRDEGKG